MPAKVTLHVYDVTNVAVTKYVNKVFKDAASVGGAFHGGIEVYGVEWSFGCTTSDCSGIFTEEPAKCSMHRYKESLDMGETNMSESEVKDLLQSMAPDWKGNTYDLLSKNCCSFCDAFAKALGVGPIPTWVNRFAGAGSSVREMGSSALTDANRAMESSGVKAKAANLVSGIQAGFASGLSKFKK
eukprot:TRINITY_DN14542_c0_g1_i1.p1 TRINITY_DN14542_c0_g1~~TRINITY_DN14542_c0_g1_i1.p1  ORF type:complete len:185 (+),score=31.51 TRINITY_DN14542_c0_g1_i1:44-598(+)